MKTIQHKQFLLIAFTCFLSSCLHEPEEDSGPYFFEICSGETCVSLKASCETHPVYQGQSGNETDRDTGLGIEHIIHVSVDGLQSDAIAKLGNTKLPALYHIQGNGAFTNNARTDPDYAATLSNHTSQFTSRTILGADGHNWTWGDDASEYCATLHYNNGSYVTSVFDVVHDYGLSTALYASKTKFVLFKNSWGDSCGAVDNVLPDSGRNKIDKYVVNTDIAVLTDDFLLDLEANKYNYAFLHLKEPDEAGHDYTWSLEDNSLYLQAVESVDVQINKLINFIDTNTDFTGKTVLIITSDHGGIFGTYNHEYSISKNIVDSGVIPFYVYGQSITAGDPYNWTSSTVVDPGTSHPLINAADQPIRNGDTANLILELLGLPNVPASNIDNLNHF